MNNRRITGAGRRDKWENTGEEVEAMETAEDRISNKEYRIMKWSVRIVELD
jgi:hypothetical protein